MKFISTAFVVLACQLSLTYAGEFNQVLSIGDMAPAWKDLPGVDDKKHSLAELDDKDIVVLVFTCNSCPIATDYEDRIIDIAQKYADPKGKVALVAVNVNRLEEDRLPNMKERAEKKGFGFPYLYDESQKIAKEYGASFTPEVFVLDRDRKIAYMGGIDDSSNPDQVKEHYLKDAIQSLLDGDVPEKPETTAIGCRIRYARDRKSK
jgi:peroxiredoxin